MLFLVKILYFYVLFIFFCTIMQEEKKNLLLLSSAVFISYGLDMVFMIAKDLNYDGIDLALFNNFDAWNIDYVKRLVDMYSIPVKSIQTSNKLNKKEIVYAVELANELKVHNININAPKYYSRKSTKFIEDNLPLYQKAHSSIKFSIINPPKNYILNFLPEYSFNNIAEILKTYKLNLSLDTSNIQEDKFDLNLIKKLPSFLSYMQTIYLSDKDRKWNWHLSLWEWNLKIPSFLKKLRQLEYDWNFIIRIDIDKKNLSDIEKIKLMLKKSKTYYLENYVNLTL